MSETAPLPFPAKPRNRSIEARRAKRVEKAVRERRIVDLLNHGVSVAEIAAREGVTEKRMRAVVREILAGRMPEGGDDYAALQLGRLNEALLAAMSAMSGTNIPAVECVVRIVRAMDRYAGFAPAGRRAAPEVRAMETEAQAPLTLPETASLENVSPGTGRAATARTGLSVVGGADAPQNDCPRMAPEPSEKIEIAPGQIRAPEAAAPDLNPARTRYAEDGEANPESVAEPPIGASLPPGLFTAGASEERATARPQMAPQSPEIVESAPDNDGRSSSPAFGSAPCPAPDSEAAPQEAPGPGPANLPYVAPDPYELAPVIAVTPTETPGVFRFVKMRIVRNGVMACG